MRDLVTRFLLDEDGATAIEYGLIAGLISIGIILSVRKVGTNLSNKFNSVAGSLT